jgi:hypothetical protein
MDSHWQAEGIAVPGSNNVVRHLFPELEGIPQNAPGNSCRLVTNLHETFIPDKDLDIQEEE